MWTPAARAELARESLPYATSLTDAEWTVVAPLLPSPAVTGRPWRWPPRLVLDAILYVLRTGCAWRHLPHEFPPWSTVHRWFLRLSGSAVFERLAHALTMADRERVGREPSRAAQFWTRRQRDPAGSASWVSAATTRPDASSDASATPLPTRTVACSWRRSRLPTCMTATAASRSCAPRVTSGPSWRTASPIAPTGASASALQWRSPSRSS